MAFLDRLVPQDTPVEAIRDPVLERAGVQLSVLRLDRIHAQISGNKWFKLIRNLDSARAQDHDTLLSLAAPGPIICMPWPVPARSAVCAPLVLFAVNYLPPSMPA